MAVANPFLLNVLNGAVDLCTGELRPHRREDLVTKVEYHPDATCPRFIAFLTEVLGRKKNLIAFMQRAAGYALTRQNG